MKLPKFAVYQKIKTDIEGETVEYGYILEQRFGYSPWSAPCYSVMLDKYWPGCENEFDPVPALFYNEDELTASNET